MNARSRRLLLCGLVLLAAPALAQRRPGQVPPPPPGATNQVQPVQPLPQTAPAQPATPSSAQAAPAQRQIAPGADTAAQPGSRTKPTCEEVKRRARYGIYFEKVDIEKLVQTVADATCKTFILPENVRGKISIVGPENGRVEVDADSFYAAFLAALDANGLTVYPHGRFLKIVEKRVAKQTTIPTIVDPDQPYTMNEQMITRVFRVKNVEVEPLRGVLNQLVSKDGDCIPYAPDTLICNDLGSNMHRLERIIDQLDTRAATDEIQVIQVQYASAQDVANTVQRIFEAKATRPGQRPGAAVMNAPGPGGQTATASGTTSGPVTLSQIIPDERTNKLVVVASPAAFDRIQRLIQEIDVPISGEGRINVHYLENANAEDLASTLQNLAQGTSSSSSARPRPAVAAQSNVAGVPQPAGGVRPAASAELFAGEVKISADKATNSLVIIASQSDFRNLVRVIEKLDLPRRQVFVEAVIMEVNLDRNARFGLQMHNGVSLTTSAGAITGIVGTNYGAAQLPPSLTGVAGLASLGGFLAGLQGPLISFGGLQIPAFGVLLNAMQQSSDVNVLSTPHLLTSDNEEAEITVGQNVPFQAAYNPGGASSLLSGLGGGAGAASLLGGGLNSLYAPINRQNVELKLTVKPQINESEMIRLVISEQTEEIASEDRVLGPTTSKRSAKTTIVARNQETVVIGGIMQDRTIESVNKIPILGDIPLLGHLFRDTTKKKVKTNLLLFLTPYIIKDQSDFREIFERKMAERQAFVEQFYGQVPGQESTVDFSRKAGPLARIQQAVLREQRKLENGGPGQPGEQLITPGTSPGPVTPTSRPPADAAPGEAPAETPAVPSEGTPAPQEGVQQAPPPPDQDELRVRPPPDDYNQE